jgi:hypothetical protein
MEKHMKYTEILSPAERLEMIKSGMVAQLSLTNGLIKAAQWERAAGPLKSSILAAALAGVPLGVAWHFLDRKTNERRRSERELQEKLKFYRNVSSNIETDLANQESPDKVIG